MTRVITQILFTEKDDDCTCVKYLKCFFVVSIQFDFKMSTFFQTLEIDKNLNNVSVNNHQQHQGKEKYSELNRYVRL